MSASKKERIRHEIQQLLHSIANGRSSEHYDVLDVAQQKRSRRIAIIICISMFVGVILGVAATIVLTDYASMQQHSIPIPDIEELKPVNKNGETTVNEPIILHLKDKD